MDDLNARFTQAVADSRQLTSRPDNMTLLQLYALYKQATEGDVQGERPGFSDLIGRAKWDAWAGLSDTPADEAKRRYIALVDALK